MVPAISFIGFGNQSIRCRIWDKGTERKQVETDYSYGTGLTDMGRGRDMEPGHRTQDTDPQHPLHGEPSGNRLYDKNSPIHTFFTAPACSKPILKKRVT